MSIYIKHGQSFNEVSFELISVFHVRIGALGFDLRVTLYLKPRY